MLHVCETGRMTGAIGLTLFVRLLHFWPYATPFPSATRSAFLLLPLDRRSCFPWFFLSIPPVPFHFFKFFSLAPYLLGPGLLLLRVSCPLCPGLHSRFVLIGSDRPRGLILAPWPAERHARAWPPPRCLPSFSLVSRVHLLRSIRLCYLVLLRVVMLW